MSRQLIQPKARKVPTKRSVKKDRPTSGNSLSGHEETRAENDSEGERAELEDQKLAEFYEQDNDAYDFSESDGDYTDKKKVQR